MRLMFREHNLGTLRPTYLLRIEGILSRDTFAQESNLSRSSKILSHEGVGGGRPRETI